MSIQLESLPWITTFSDTTCKRFWSLSMKKELSRGWYRKVFKAKTTTAALLKMYCKSLQFLSGYGQYIVRWIFYIYNYFTAIRLLRYTLIHLCARRTFRLSQRKGMSKDAHRTLQSMKKVFDILSPYGLRLFCHEVMKWSCYMWYPTNESSVERAKH